MTIRNTVLAGRYKLVRISCEVDTELLKVTRLYGNLTACKRNGPGEISSIFVRLNPHSEDLGTTPRGTQNTFPFRANPRIEPSLVGFFSFFYNGVLPTLTSNFIGISLKQMKPLFDSLLWVFVMKDIADHCDTICSSSEYFRGFF